jgi:hypothetical protein
MSTDAADIRFASDFDWLTKVVFRTRPSQPLVHT